MTIVRWEPLHGSRRPCSTRVFDAPSPHGGGTLRRWMPAMDLVETEDHFVLRADLPGLSEDDIKIEFEDRTLTVSGERKAEHESKAEGYYRVERAFGSFSRSLTLPQGIDPEAVTASFDRGVLEVRIPKPEERKPRRIEIGGEPKTIEALGPRSRRRGYRPRLRVLFDIHTRDAGSRARTGTLRLAHGEVRTPAFVPLATKAVVKTLEVREAAELGFDMVLGNTFHLFLTPGHELIAQLGGLHRFMRWDRPVITDSGGFQVFSMGHGTVADEIKGRAAQSAAASASGAILKIEEEGVTFRSYLDGSTQFMGPETSMEIQAALARTSRSCSTSARRSTAAATTRRARPSARTAGSTAAWPGTPQHGPEGQVVYGIVQGGVEEDLRRASAQEVAARPVGGIAIGGTLGEHKDQMFEVVDWAVHELDEARPRHLLGIGEIDDLVRGVELGIDTFDCAMPTRIGRHGMARRARSGEALARRPRQGPLPRRPTSRCSTAARAPPARTATRAPTCTTCSRRTSRPPSGCSRSTTSPTCSG